jgi:hypothetical protein
VSSAPSVCTSPHVSALGEGTLHHSGQELRLRLSPQTFRSWFLIGLTLLGAYLVVMEPV